MKSYELFFMTDIKNLKKTVGLFIHKEECETSL